ncbi:MAG: hypothetical protein BMS9Abin17_0761 [Acidimicrobiia bacterium]|nr:MAG: hypothetical protein BMS9Abin17_0761 [Acidimicrobiia bacterium]
MDELLKKVAEIRGMPASLVERSAQARAEKTGTTLQAVLEEWLGEATGKSEAETVEVSQPESSEPVTGETPPEASEKTQKSSDTISTDDLVHLAADAKRMPTKLILSSAQARATHAGSTLEAVLAEWAGVDLDDLQTSPQAQTPEETPVEAPDTEPVEVSTEKPTEDASEQPDVAATAGTAVAAVAAGAAGATAMSMDELLEKVAEAKGMPASLAKRSAEARAKKTGEPLEVVLAEWAGVDVATVSSDAPTSAGDAEPTQAVPTEPQPDSPAGDPAETPGEGVEIIEPSGANQDEVETIEETPPPRGGYPKWLAAAFLLIPLLAVTYLMVSPNGPDCGSGGQLRIDPVTGEAVNCDGSDYGETTADYFAAGGAIYAQCAACHSADGTGGVGPSFASGAVLETFPIGQCTTQIEWVGIGTAGWPDPTYGATAKPVGGVGLMPGFGNSLSEQQLAEVALFERVQFGGQELQDAEIDCGLVEASSEG